MACSSTTRMATYSNRSGEIKKMGMESFFFHLVPNGVRPIMTKGLNSFDGTANMSLVELKERLSKCNYTLTCKGRSDHQKVWVLDDSLLFKASHVNGYLQEITIEGCFSWFEECIQYCYKVIISVNWILPIRFYYPSEAVKPLSEIQDFEQQLWELHGVRFNRFNEVFGEMDERLLPGDEFYLYWRNIHGRSLWSTLKRYFRT